MPACCPLLAPARCCPAHPSPVALVSPACPTALPLSPHVQASCAPALPHAASSHIGAVHVDAALAELAADAAFPPLPSVSNTRPATFAAAWAARQQAAASCTAVTAAPGLLVDAEDVAPRTPAAAATTPYLPPARREGATSAVLAGCALAYPAPAQPASIQPRAAYVPPHRRTPEQQAAAAEAGRPGRPGPFPYLTAGPLPQPPAEAPWPLYRLALLFPSQRC